MSTQKAKKVNGIVLKSQLDTDCPAECAICIKTPKHKDALITDCNHIFCVKCWYTYTHTLPVHRTISCPMCRKNNPDPKMFRCRDHKNSNPHISAHNTFIGAIYRRAAMRRPFIINRPAALYVRAFDPTPVNYVRVVNPNPTVANPNPTVVNPNPTDANPNPTDANPNPTDDNEVIFLGHNLPRNVPLYDIRNL